MLPKSAKVNIERATPQIVMILLILLLIILLIMAVFIYKAARISDKEQDIITTSAIITTTLQPTSTVITQRYTSCIIRTWDFGNGTKRLYCYPIKPEKVQKKNV